MTDLGQIVGHRAALATLARMRERNRVPHAILFHGPEGVGKFSVARAYGALLLCERDQVVRCGECSSCRLVETESHPDLLRVGRLTRDEKTAPERKQLTTGKADAGEGDLRAEILIDQIRQLNRIAGGTPRVGRRRVFVVDPADRLNREAQNALLKTLEEPPRHSLLFLVSARPHALLPTVRSRCFSLGFAALRTDELTDLLIERGVQNSEAPLRAAFADGRVGRALRLDLDGLRQRRDDVLQMLEALSAGRLGGLPEMASVLAGKDEPSLVEGLDLLQGLLRDALVAVSGADATPRAHPDLVQELGKLGQRIGQRRLTELVGDVDRLRGYLRFNANRVLLAESLLAAVSGAPLPI